MFNTASPTRTLGLPFLALALCLAAAPQVTAQESAQDGPLQPSMPAPFASPEGEPPAPPAAPMSPAHTYFTDVVLVNHLGEEMRLYSDLLQGHTVVMSPFFTTCTGVCPVLSKKLAGIQAALGDRLGEDLVMLMITVDPENDTPERLAAYARGFDAKPGWYFLSGTKQNVDWALYKFGHYVENKESHGNLFIVGNERTGLWKKVFGLSDVQEILPIVEGVLEDQGS